MNFIPIKEEIVQTILNQLIKFAASEKAKKVYAIAIDVEEFDYVMRYQTVSGYHETKARYLLEYGYQEADFADESLTGFKYAVGDFSFVGDIAEEKLGASEQLKDFFDSMAYYNCDYIEDESRLLRREELPENLYSFLLEACLTCAERLKDNLPFLDKTDDFILFVTEHDISNEAKLKLISKTVEPFLFEKLCQNCAL